ncbi:hypothetical protein BJX70DRAFT_357082 [Aspergillus crustosus]
MTHWIRKVLSVARHWKQRRRYERLSSSDDLSEEVLSWSLLLKLPLDILLLIIPRLPLVSQVCLALTCKPLYKLLHSALDDKQLAWPKYLASPPSKAYNQPPLPRNELLLKLEDTRWLYCRDCLKLHPHSHFCLVQASVPSSTRYCILGVGVADLCACVALTYTNGVQLASWIQTGVPSQMLPRNICQQFRLQDLDTTRILIHKCSVTSQPDAFLTFTAKVSLTADRRLIITTRYTVYWSEPHKNPGTFYFHERYRPPNDTEAPFLCPHIHGLAWLYGINAQSQEYKCGLCDTNYRVLDYTNDGLRAVIQAERNLGIMHNDPYQSQPTLQSPSWWHGSRQPGNPMEKFWYRELWVPR